jgi:hypothetical protein
LIGEDRMRYKRDDIPVGYSLDRELVNQVIDEFKEKVYYTARVIGAVLLVGTFAAFAAYYAATCDGAQTKENHHEPAARQSQSIDDFAKGK